MVQNDNKIVSNQHEITMEDFREFSQAKSYQEQLRILMSHSEKNKKRIELKKEIQEDKGEGDRAETLDS